MIAAWMLYCTGIAFLIGAAAVALERTGRLIGLSGRWVWGGALLATLALPLAALYRPAAFQSVVVPVPAVQSQNGPSASPTVTTAPSVLPFKPAFSLLDLDRPLELLWGGLSIALLGFVIVAAARLDLQRRRWRSVTVDGTPVFVSANLGPAVIGVVRARLVIPEWTLELEPNLRDLMLEHEREHIRVGDPLLLAAAGVLLALMPWNLGLWWQWRRLRLALEMDCDVRVLRRHPDPARYGGLLLEVSQRASHSLLPIAAFHEPMSLLERRIRAFTTGQPTRLGLQVAVSTVAAVLLAVGACEAPRPTSVPNGSPPASEDVQSADVLQEKAQRLAGPVPVYPPLLLQAGIQGVVIVEAIVDTAGHVEPNSVRIVESPHPGFNQQAKEVVLHSLYRPGLVNGKPVRALIRQAIGFPTERQPLTRAVPPPAQQTDPYLPTVHELTEVAGRFHPDALKSPRRQGAAIALVFDATDSVIGHAAGAREAYDLSCDAVVKRLLPEFAGVRFSSGGCAVVNPGGVVVYWGSLRRP
jgi:TonB family protein